MIPTAARFTEKLCTLNQQLRNAGGREKVEGAEARRVGVWGVICHRGGCMSVKCVVGVSGLTLYSR